MTALDVCGEAVWPKTTPMNQDIAAFPTSLLGGKVLIRVSPSQQRLIRLWGRLRHSCQKIGAIWEPLMKMLLPPRVKIQEEHHQAVRPLQPHQPQPRHQQVARHHLQRQEKLRWWKTVLPPETGNGSQKLAPGLWMWTGADLTSHAA